MPGSLEHLDGIAAMTTYHSLQTAPAGARLRELAKVPYDLTAPGALLAAGRLRRYRTTGTYYSLSYGTQRLDDQVLDLLQQLADECGLVAQFKAMRRGAILNRIVGHDSENRQVLHTACRDIFAAEPKEPATTAQARAELVKLERFLSEIASGALTATNGERFTTMVHVGIGGSDLGPRSLYEALRPFAQHGRTVRFIANVDPDDAAAVLADVDLSRALVAIVSKSGTTLETRTNEELVRSRLTAQGLDPGRHLLAVTGEGSPMDDPSRYLRSFYMFDSVGGRYSSSSMVGCLPLGFALGFSQLREFLRGAAVVDEEAEEADIRNNIPLLMALVGIWNHNFLGAPTLAILPYCQGLHRFPAHLQQCDMESNGKSITREGKPVTHQTGPVIWGEPGTNGQHAFYQLLHQGTEVVPVEFIGYLENQYSLDVEVAGSSSRQKLLANLMAQAVALAQGQQQRNPNKVFPGNRPASVLLGRRLTPETMGALLATYEAKIVLQGFAWNINSFDQEGVQLGKVLATTFLTVMQEGEAAGAELEHEYLKALWDSLK